mgnify:FL=1|tara:strand:- start:1397 stop:1951 length:555 start_codon:yes stop_codon:yes gene_type:complete
MIHYLKNISLTEDSPDKFKEIILGAGCFWGVEKQFWDLPGVYNTLVGYSGGDTENPTYEDVCYKETNHAEVVKVVYDPAEISLKVLLKIFWECHDPTQGMRQGNDIGTQYRSTIYTSDDSDLGLAKEMKDIYQSQLEKNNLNKITTEIEIVKNFYLAEEYHQQYLAKNPNGYCGIGGTGCTFPK